LLADGKVLVAGGSNEVYTSHPLASAELYDPAKGTWKESGSLATARIQHTATLLPDGKILVAGGLGGSGYSGLASVELYDPVRGTWQRRDALWPFAFAIRLKPTTVMIRPAAIATHMRSLHVFNDCAASKARNP
jgi:hypothetical protein